MTEVCYCPKHGASPASGADCFICKQEEKSMDSKPTDKELAASVRDLFSALRRAISSAEKAGLRVDFSDRVDELLAEPER